MIKIKILIVITLVFILGMSLGRLASDTVKAVNVTLELITKKDIDSHEKITQP